MSKLINNPAVEEVINNSENSATIVISPVYQGYGNTLGNSLRRVLLSSIRGGAVVQDSRSYHEFTNSRVLKSL